MSETLKTFDFPARSNRLFFHHFYRVATLAGKAGMAGKAGKAGNSYLFQGK